MHVQSKTEQQLVATSDNVLPFYLDKVNQGHRVCLATIVRVDGTAPRAVGSQIAVSDDGDCFGFVTGGCAQSAIVHEALMAIREKSSRTIRIGSDSPWFDIKLPCGAGIDLYFSVADSHAVVDAVCRQLIRRKPVTVEIDMQSDSIEIVDDHSSSNQSKPKRFLRTYRPPFRLAVFGSGPYVDCLNALATSSEFGMLLWTPDEEHQHIDNVMRYPLSRTTEIDGGCLDPWTAAVLLFHEHDWEPRLLKAILASHCFYVGALGSRTTHASRLAELRKLGVAADVLNRIHGPVGLDIGARTPAEIAISIMAEIVRAKNQLPDELISR